MKILVFSLLAFSLLLSATSADAGLFRVARKVTVVTVKTGAKVTYVTGKALYKGGKAVLY